MWGIFTLTATLITEPAWIGLASFVYTSLYLPTMIHRKFSKHAILQALLQPSNYPLIQNWWQYGDKFVARLIGQATYLFFAWKITLLVQHSDFKTPVQFFLLLPITIIKLYV